MNDNLLRMLPQVDKWLQSKSMQAILECYPRAWVVNAMQDSLSAVREKLRSDSLQTVNIVLLEENVAKALAKRGISSLRRVVNASGVIVHTNLGRIPLAQEVAQHAADIAMHYNTLEYDLNGGGRGSRDKHIVPLLQELTGVEDAFVVNNNAAAVLLVLDTIAKGKKVIVSRGELVEIGGGFRVPDIMAHMGAKLVEVGTTNRTRTEDYADVIDEDTAALMVVHRSNFKIIGFTHTPQQKELTALARAKHICSIYDFGGGLLEESMEFSDEQTVKDAIAADFDVVTFSGDKLLGGPQCGIIAGKKEIIEEMRKNPLVRALRVDKMTMAALEATLWVYSRNEQFAKLPLLKMLNATPESLKEKAESLALKLVEVCVSTQTKIGVVESDSRVGGGAMPEHVLPSFAVTFDAEGISAEQMAIRLRQNEDIPVIARIVDDKLFFDLRTVADDEIDIVVSSVKKALEGFNC